MAVGALVLVVVVVGLLLPTQYTVRRSLVMGVSSDVIHQYVGDLSQWEAWAPWKEEDPSLVVTLGAKTVGIGASQSWVGKDGDGSLKVTAFSQTKGIEYDLFLDGCSIKCRSALHYRTKDEGTEVTWIMKGDFKLPVVGGFLALMMDSMVGPMFERGLENLKQTVETS